MVSRTHAPCLPPQIRVFGHSLVNAIAHDRVRLFSPPVSLRVLMCAEIPATLSEPSVLPASSVADPKVDSTADALRHSDRTANKSVRGGWGLLPSGGNAKAPRDFDGGSDARSSAAPGTLSGTATHQAPVKARRVRSSLQWSEVGMLCFAVEARSFRRLPPDIAALDAAEQAAYLAINDEARQKLRASRKAVNYGIGACAAEAARSSNAALHALSSASSALEQAAAAGECGQCGVGARCFTPLACKRLRVVPFHSCIALQLPAQP